MSMENVEDVYSLSPMQEGMLFHSISAPNSGVFVEQICFTLTGNLNLGILRQAWNEVVRRHTVLRQGIVWDGVDEPLQIVFSTIEMPWSELDWTDVSCEDQREQFQQLRDSDREKGFDLAAAPLMRMLLIRETSDSWRVMWTFHHILVDGWSGPILLNEWFETYEALLKHSRPELPEPFLYRDYIAWLKERPTGADEAFWKDYLKGFHEPTKIQMPTAALPVTPGSESANPYRQSEQCLPAESMQSLLQAARNCKVTLNSMVQGAWALLISRYTSADDVVLGVTSAGRPADLPHVDSAVGLFINTLPLRVSVDERLKFRDWIGHVQQRNTSIKDYEYSSLAKVQSCSEVESGIDLFDSLVVFENYPDGDALGAGLSQLQLECCEYFEQSNYPLALLVVPGDSLRLILIHDSSKIDSAAAQSMLEHVTNLLVGFSNSPEQSLRDIAMLDDSQQKRLLAQGIGEAVEWPQEETLHGLFARQIAARPDEIAATFEDRSITYGEWAAAAESLAGRLQNDGVLPGQRVGVHAERSIDLIVGLLAILKVGGVYVPIDPSLPLTRKQYIIDDAQVALLLTQQRLANTVSELNCDFQIIDDDEIANSMSASSTGFQPIEITNDAPAYVIYTSGSTGQPKGVSVSHRSIVHSTTARFNAYDRQPQAFLLLSPIAFDSCLAGLFWTLASGGELVLPGKELEKDLEHLSGLMIQRRVSHLLCLPSLYRLMLENCDRKALSGLQVAIVAGEACPVSISRSHWEITPQCHLYNEYGPTEAAVWATVYQFSETDSSGPVPIGKPIPRMNAFVLDAWMRPVPTGIAGELFLAGPGLADGYLGAVDSTDQRFVQHDLPGIGQCRLYRTGDQAYFQQDGNLVFVGRTDGQVKIRGFRIELGEIEETLNQRVDVRESVVTAQESTARSGKRLVAYFVSADEAQPDENTLRTFVRERLPSHMVPADFILVDSIPRLSNGKVDAQSLPRATASSDSDYVAPRNEIETTLAKIWSEVIGVEQVGVTDNFFALGGDSIISIQMISRARQAGIQLQPKHITRNPTVAELAIVASSTTNANRSGKSTGAFVLSPIQNWFFENDFANANHWNLSRLFELPEVYDVDTLQQSLANVVAAHDLSRVRFVESGDGTWSGFLADEAEGFSVEPAFFDPANVVAFEASCLQFQQSLDIKDGPLFRAIRFQNSDSPDRLLLVVHHLVIDAVSWQIVLEDFEFCFRNSGRVERAACSFPQFSQTLLNQANAESVLRTLDSWKSIFDSADQIHWPFKNQTETITESSIGYLDTVVDATTTLALRTTANQAFNTSAHQLLISALGLSLAAWTGASQIPLVLESHGRDGDWVDDLDLTRTVGWLTSVFPVALPVNVSDVEQTVKGVKDELNRMQKISGHYGLLSYLASPPNRLDCDMSKLPVLFNYLGVKTTQESVLKPIAGADSSSRYHGNSRQQAIEIVAVIIDDELHFRWGYCRSRIDREEVESLAISFTSQLESLLSVCTESEGGFTPTDFSDVDLSQQELNDFLAELD